MGTPILSSWSVCIRDISLQNTWMEHATLKHKVYSYFRDCSPYILVFVISLVKKILSL